MPNRKAAKASTLAYKQNPSSGELWLMAQAYLDAANTCYAECQRRDQFANGSREVPETFQVIPSVFLYFRAIELALKSAIRQSDLATPNQIRSRSLGHNLKALIEQATVGKDAFSLEDLGMNREAKDHIERWSDDYGSKSFEYEFGPWNIPDPARCQIIATPVVNAVRAIARNIKPPVSHQHQQTNHGPANQAEHVLQGEAGHDAVTLYKTDIPDIANNGLFNKEVASIELLHHKELDIFVGVLEGRRQWDEYFDTSQRNPLPAWLAKMAKQWKTVWLYKIDNTITRSDCLSLIYNRKTGKARVYTKLDHTVILMLEVVFKPGEPTPEQVWPIVRNDMLEYRHTCLYETLICNPQIIPRAEIEDFLKTQLKKENMKRLENDRGPTVKEWAENIYAKKRTP